MYRFTRRVHNDDDADASGKIRRAFAGPGKWLYRLVSLLLLLLAGVMFDNCWWVGGRSVDARTLRRRRGAINNRAEIVTDFCVCLNIQCAAAAARASLWGSVTQYLWAVIGVRGPPHRPRSHTPHAKWNRNRRLLSLRLCNHTRIISFAVAAAVAVE